MGYSKITSIEVTNFMVYSHAKLVFDERGIVNLKGYNSSGKSSLLKAIGVCLFDLYPKAQGKLIKHGEDYFRVVVSFDDGVSIIRDKYANGQSLYEMYKDGKCVLTTKEGRKLTKIDGVPQMIQDYLGLCITSLGCLNYQSRQDPLWLVETTGSENYASLNEVLKTEEISRASALINTDRNKLGAEITGIEAQQQATREARVDAEKYTADLLISLEAAEKRATGYLTQYDTLDVAWQTVTDLEVLKPIPEVEKVDYQQLEDIENMLKAISELERIKPVPVVETMGTARLADLERLLGIYQQLISEREKAVPSVGIMEGGERLQALLMLMSAIEEQAAANRQLKAIKRETAEIANELETAAKKARDEGTVFAKCNNCGSYIAVEV